MKKAPRLAVLLVFILLPLLCFHPRIALFYGACGAYDVSRNKGLNGFVLRRYFFGNGLLTWLLSPFNILMDLLTLPYGNKGVYRLEELPKPYRDEIRTLLNHADAENLPEKLREPTEALPRTMIFYKWYGSNVPATVDVPAFRKPYKYIQTIGVSVFNQREKTSRHFGPFRATLRVLYNLNPMEDRSAYIEVGTTRSYWTDRRLFIFDDTLMHQSVNESDRPRFCLFVDVLRPALFPGPLRLVVRSIRGLLNGVNHVFYKNWKVLRA